MGGYSLKIGLLLLQTKAIIESLMTVEKEKNQCTNCIENQ